MSTTTNNNNCKKDEEASSPPPSSSPSYNKESKEEEKESAEDSNTLNKTESNSDALIQEKANALFLNTEILAPMVRASTTPLRTLALQYGADLVYTEEIIDRSITTCDRIINKELNTIDYIRKLSTFSPKVRKRMKNQNDVPVILRIDPNIERGKLIYQMGTGEADLALPAALMVEQDVDGIDVNMGCPKKFSVSGGMGSALLSDVKRACSIISTLRLHVKIPVSAKIRLLKTNEDTVNFILALIEAGANAVTIHAREVGDASQQPAKWDRLVEVVRALKKEKKVEVPIIINGDLYTRKDMVQMRRKCGADGVMLARPALYNTSIFCKPPPNNDTATKGTEKENDLEQYSYKSKLLQSKTSVIQQYIQHAVRYKTNSKNVKYVVCEMMNNRRAPTKITPYLPQNFVNGQTIDKVCKTRSLGDLCKLWNVSEEEEAKNRLVVKDAKEKEQPTGEHRYDDRYFLDHDGFQKERHERCGAEGEEKKENIENHDCTKNSSLYEADSEKIKPSKNEEKSDTATDVNGKRRNEEEEAGSTDVANASKRPKMD